LRAPGTAMEMTAPRLHGVGFDEDPDADDEDFDLVDDEFDKERFAIDG
jgi:hypothetical protein